MASLNKTLKAWMKYDQWTMEDAAYIFSSKDHAFETIWEEVKLEDGTYKDYGITTSPLFDFILLILERYDYQKHSLVITDKKKQLVSKTIWIDIAFELKFDLDDEMRAEFTRFQNNTYPDNLQEAANHLAEQYKSQGSKKFTKREIASDLAKSNDWKEYTAGRIERIIRKQW